MWIASLIKALELWQVPLVIGALVLILAYPVAWFAEGWHLPARVAKPARLGRTAVRVRTAVLLLLSLVLLGLLVVTVQNWELSSAAANVAAVASFVLQGFSLRLAYLSYREGKELELTSSPRSPAEPLPSSSSSTAE